jgi:protein-S-isoprenylcysteine O-methyltransferase Ste14
LQDWVARIRVPAGFILAVLFFYFSRPTWISLALGTFVAMLGLLIRAWATGHLQKNDELATGGPYALTRNPLYLGSFVIGIGFSIAGRNAWICVLFLGSFAAIYGCTMNREMRHLQILFPEDYARYQGRVPPLFPRLRHYELGERRFSLDRYWKNREYQALLGFLGAVLILMLKILYS